MARVALALFWHQHQPYYPDDVSGQTLMPWVRLHGAKDYYGMAAILEEIPEFHCTINYVPSLIVQLQGLIDGKLVDRPLAIARKPAADLTAEEVCFALDNLFLADHERMIRPFARYHELLQKRAAGRLGADRAARRFNAQDLLDLQVWANLVWFHPIAFERDAELQELRDKGRRYTEDDKQRVLDKQMALLAEVAPMHARLQQRGQIELTTTPFYHPIMPLLWDKRLAREAMPDVPLPRQTQGYPEDVVTHVRRAVEFHETTFGEKPRGMWPSEGSVCQAIIPVLAEAGIEWIATDEEILSKSLGGQVGRDRHGHVQHPELLYQPWRVTEHGRSLQIVFRDHALSDLVGFQYQRAAAAAAVDDFMAKLKAIGDASAGEEVLVSVILDGENCWEYYPDQGLDFLRRLYRRVIDEPAIRPVRISDYLTERPASKQIDRLFAGSWISHNFAIWIGHPEDNRAWKRLHETRETLKRISSESASPVAPEDLERAWEELYIAEGSDWFWWFGDDHSSAQDALFDQLFRTHLKNVYHLLGMDPPIELDEPIHRAATRAIYSQPRSFLRVDVNGRRSFFEWLTAGHYHCRSERGTMTMVAAGLLQDVYFGFDRERLFLRADTEGPASQALHACERIRVVFAEPAGYEASLELTSGRMSLVGPAGDVEAVGLDGAIDHIVEMAIPFAALGAGPGDRLRLFVELDLGGIDVERSPHEGAIEIEAPGDDFEEIMWQV